MGHIKHKLENEVKIKVQAIGMAFWILGFWRLCPWSFARFVRSVDFINLRSFPPLQTGQGPRAAPVCPWRQGKLRPIFKMGHIKLKLENEVKIEVQAIHEANN